MLLFAFSLMLWIYGNIFFPTATFYLPITRAWELLAGVFLAIHIHRHGFLTNKLFSAIGLIVLFLSFFIFSVESDFKNIFMPLPVLGTLMILSANNHYSFVKAVLMNKASIFFGLISYSLYLFHQPIFAFAKIYFIDLEIFQIIILIIFAIFISFFSWRYFEQIFRIRYKSQLNFSKIIAILSLPFLLSLLIATYSIKTDGNRSNYLNKLDYNDSQTILLLEGIKEENEKDLFIDNGECVVSANNFSIELQSKILDCKKRFGKGILFFGDSHAKDIFNSYQYSKQSKFIIGIAANFCQAHEKISHCYFSELKDFLKSSPDIFEKIYFHQAGYFFLGKNGNEFNDKSFFENLPLIDDSTDFTVSRKRIQNLKLNLDDFSENLIILGPKIEPHIQNKYIKKYTCQNNFLTRRNLDNAFKQLDEFFSEIFHPEKYISLQKTINFSMTKDFINCDAIYWSDGDHWSKSGEIYFSKRVVKGLSIKDT